MLRMCQKYPLAVPLSVTQPKWSHRRNGHNAMGFWCVQHFQISGKYCGASGPTRFLYIFILHVHVVVVLSRREPLGNFSKSCVLRLIVLVHFIFCIVGLGNVDSSKPVTVRTGETLVNARLKGWFYSCWYLWRCVHLMEEDLNLK